MQFDASTVDTTPDTVPLDWYPVVITEADERQNSKGTGRLIELAVTIINGQYANRKAREWISYKHDNSAAQEIGQKKLAKICKALNIPQLTDESLLIGGKLEARLGPDESYNGIFDYRAAEQVDAFAGMQSDIDQAGITEASTVTAANPWEK